MSTTNNTFAIGYTNSGKAVRFTSTPAEFKTKADLIDACEVFAAYALHSQPMVKKVARIRMNAMYNAAQAI